MTYGNNGSHPPIPPIISLAEFIAEAKDPEFLIEPFLQRGYLYTLTARTSHGKTALLIYLAICVAHHLHNFAGHHTNHGRVVMLAGENPDDTASRFAAIWTGWASIQKTSISLS
jgi:RecA-family ATPase